MMGGDVRVRAPPAPGALKLDIPSSPSSYVKSSSISCSRSRSTTATNSDLIAWPPPPNERTLWAMEILDSEDKFLGLLKRLVNVYLLKLPPVLSTSGAALLARNSATLLELHTRLASDFKTNKYSRSGLCQVLTSYASELTSLYQEFSAGHVQAKSLLNRHRLKDPKIWAQWERERAAESGPETDGSRSRSFEDLLIAPIQRVCRYHMLAVRLRDGTNEPQVAGTIAAMQAILVSISEIIRTHADDERAKVVLERMDPVPGLSPSFLASLGPCRLISTLDVVYYQVGKSQGTSKKPPKATHLAAFLWPGYLVLCKTHTRRNRYEPKRWFPLRVVHTHPKEISEIEEADSEHSRTVIRSGVSDSSSVTVSFSKRNLPRGSSRQLEPKVISVSKAPSIQLRPEKHPIPTYGLGHVRVEPSEQVFAYGIRVSFSRHVFELGASCREERDIWARAIADARVE